MTDVLENAKQRLHVLRQEAEEIERFIAMYERFGGGTNGGHVDVRHESVSGNLSTRNAPVDNFVKRRNRVRGDRPDDVALFMEKVIRERGEPMTRGQLVEALELRDVAIPAVDKPRYIGTIAWRTKGTFVNIEGRGYWLRDAGVPLMTGTPIDHQDFREQPEEHSDELFE